MDIEQGVKDIIISSHPSGMRRVRFQITQANPTASESVSVDVLLSPTEVTTLHALQSQALVRARQILEWWAVESND